MLVQMVTSKVMEFQKRRKPAEVRLKTCEAGPYTKKPKCVDCGWLNKAEVFDCCEKCGSTKAMESVVVRDIYTLDFSTFVCIRVKVCSQMAENPGIAEKFLTESGYKLVDEYSDIA